MLPKLPIITALASLILLATSASAAEVTEHKVVRYGNLDIAQDRDAQIMARRIASAALEVCGGGHGHLADVNKAVLRSKCWKDAVVQAAEELNAPKVSAALAGSSGQ